MRFQDDPRTLLTLDAGGTHLVFSAMRAGREVSGSLAVPSRAENPNAFVDLVSRGFETLRSKAGAEPVALALGFPGPADYRAGVVGPQKNLPCIREPLDLGSILRRRFGVPVLLHNDADLFVYGEALGGFLPHVNGLLQQAGSASRCRSLFGITLGTGLGAGYTLNGRMVTGDRGGGPEIWCLPSGPDPSQPAEEHASARAVARSYAELADVPKEEVPEPRVLLDIAEGRAPGDAKAAREAFRRLGAAAGHAAACAISLSDCPLVIGGGLSGAAPLILPALVLAMNARLVMPSGREVSRMDGRAYDLEVQEGRDSFLREATPAASGTGGEEEPPSVTPRRFPVGLSRLGTSRAAALGAYAAALEALDGT